MKKWLLVLFLGVVCLTSFVSASLTDGLISSFSMDDSNGTDEHSGLNLEYPLIIPSGYMEIGYNITNNLPLVVLE